jgi:hypothetical protein
MTYQDFYKYIMDKVHKLQAAGTSTDQIALIIIPEMEDWIKNNPQEYVSLISDAPDQAVNMLNKFQDAFKKKLS